MTTFETLKLLFMLLLITCHSTCLSEPLQGNVTKENTIKHNIVRILNLKPNKNDNHLETVEKKEKITLNWLTQTMKRSKRQHTVAATGSLSHPFEMPSVPLPPPPPFPHNTFNISPFQSKSSTGSFTVGAGGGGGAAAAGMPVSKSINPFTFKNQNNHQHSPATTASAFKCGGILKARHGVIHTPNFPHKFSTPIECVWIIDASDLVSHNGHNISIVVYLTQLYVLGGLKFTEYMYYSDDYKVPAHRVFTLTEDDVTQVAWVQFNSQYLEIRFRMSSLDGTHLRALDRLLDVYGFNMTYEVETVKDYQCNTLQCRFLGHCYARQDFSSYYCSCFPGFSGVDCGRGPLCDDPHTNICQNGGTCKHIGDAAITCHCPNGYKGTKCEIPDISDITMGCTSNSSASECHKECDFDNGRDGGISLLKTSRTSARSGKTRYEVTIRLGANLTAFYRNVEGEQKAREQLPTFLEKHLMRVLRNFNITKISDLELISNTTDRLDITFHFFGIKGDSNRIREAITRMVERGKIGNITLVSNYHLFDENPPLNLMDLSVNQKQIIREDSEFILSCTAQGSARMQFQWYKDGIMVNASKAIREIWTTVLPPESKDIFTAILGISKANRLDEGIYTCKVTDWGVEQCRSMHVHIKSPPRLRVDPASVTLHKGDSLRVRCLSPGNDDIKRYAQLGYSWTRNGNLFQSDPKTVMWEDLYPDGSILKINNIQKSAEYSCVVSNTVKPVSKSVYITVIDRNAVHVCHADTAFAVHWPTSAPGGVAVISDCPRGFEGFSRRTCEKRDAGNSTWLTPDFSNCIRDQLLMIYNKFRALVSGFQQTTTSELLKACLGYTLRRYKQFLPGEAGFLIDMLHELDNYLQLKGTQLEREMAAEIILHILDKVMQNTQSLNSQQQIKKLQLLTQSAALNRETIAASQLATSTSTGSIKQAQASSSAASSSASSSSIASPSSSSSSQHITTLTQASSIEDRHANTNTATVLTTNILTHTHTKTNNNNNKDTNKVTAAESSFSSSSSSSQSQSLAGNTANMGNRQTLLKTDILHATATMAAADNTNRGVGGIGVDSASAATARGMGNNDGVGIGVGHGSILTVDEDSLSLDRLNSLRIYMTSIKTLPFNLRIYGDDLFSDQLYMDIGLSNRLLNIMANNTIFASVISYKHLKSFLPKTYYTRGSDPKESDYILASRIIQTWLFQSNRSNDNMREPLDLPFEHGHVEIIFQHERAPKDSDWMAVCGHDYKASFESSWRSDLCITKNLMENITRCICPVSGTYVVMLTKRNNHSHHLSPPPRPIFVIISCVCCLLQSCSAFIILLPIWYNRQCATTFLKMQFCVSTSSIMVIFLLGFLKMLPLNWQPIISSSLASLLLLGISTLIAIALVIHSELVPKKLFHVNNNKSSTTATNSTISTAVVATATNINAMTSAAGNTTTAAAISSTGGGGGGDGESPVILTQRHEQQLENANSNILTHTNIAGVATSLANTNMLATATANTTTTIATGTATAAIAGTGAGMGSVSTTSLKPPLRYIMQQQHHQQQQQQQARTSFSTSGVRGAIGISWLLPLLFAITSPLICTINGKWPQNWWLEIMSHTTSPTTYSSYSYHTATSLMDATTTGAAVNAGSVAFAMNAATNSFVPLNERYIRTYLTPFTTEPPLLSNGDSVLEFNATTTTVDNSFAHLHPAAATPITATTTSSGSSSSSNIIDTTTTIWSHSLQTSRSPVTSISTFLHNEDIFATGQGMGMGTGTGTSTFTADGGIITNAASGGVAGIGAGVGSLQLPAASGPALNFILFLFVDLLFILLFFALFAILIKKLLWLWHKNRRTNNAATAATTATTTTTTAVAANSNIMQQQQQQQHLYQQQTYQYNNTTTTTTASAAAMDKFNTIMKQRIGLLYRTGCLLLIKLLTDALFIVYSNSIVMETTWWCYPFGISCILMGFTILFCFILKPECPLRCPRGSSTNSNFSTTGVAMKKKLSTSKTSLDDNYCTGSITAPINFYTNHEKETESCAAAPPLMHKTPPSPARHNLELSAATCQMPGLTIISTAPRCQMMPLMAATSVTTAQATGPQQQEHVTSVETFIGGTTQNTATLERKATAQQQQQQHMQHLQQITSNATASISSPASRCCNILGVVGVGGSSSGSGAGNMPQQPQHQLTGMPQVVSGSSVGYYDAYGAGTIAMQTLPPTSLNMTGSLSRRTHLTTAPHHHHLHHPTSQHHYQQQQHQHQLQPSNLTHEYVGVETLDILQGVAPDTLIGIRSTMNPVSICPSSASLTSYHPTTGLQYTPASAQLIPAGAIVSISGLTTNAGPTTATINYTIPATIITTTSVTTQTPKTQKRVTIMEPTTNHTFDPLLPTMVALAGANTSAAAATAAAAGTANPIPIITIAAAAAVSQADDKISNKNLQNAGESEVETEADVEDEDTGGMLDRITHDLNYLLNGAEDDQIPPPPRPPVSSTNDLVNAEVIFKTDEL